jgi:hypothetical protein
MGQAGEYNREVKNLVTTAKMVKGLWGPLLRDLSSMKPKNLWNRDDYPHGVNRSSCESQNHPIQAHALVLDAPAIEQDAV